MPTKLLVSIACGLLFALVHAQSGPPLIDLDYQQVVSPTCAQFINSFSQSEEFQSCRPISFYVSTSMQFTRMAETNVSDIDEILSASCSIEEVSCQEPLQSIRKQMISKQSCGSDLATGNTVADKIFQALANHHLYQRIGCLKELDSGEYCLANIYQTRASSSLYRLPFGEEFNASNSSNTQICSLCSKKVMDIYSRFGAQWLNKLTFTYEAAREWFSNNCGESYTRIMSAETSSASTAFRWLWLITFLPVIW
ncbi:hypothetical protein K493DRAFT_303480 [Basidiobolus meristosporus CBS 931.73]|uniref:DUF7729 domain-containing protein n=1 Tax=Basidiobolus meristosporus CBS 931.73 TaxID=1314790 RepID=A0A1Y1Y2F2_9FUNG|nr:hypothetical protein K493DRAFT_303480 [Basidiobolus meristosporus CBS 931.73]|eukprot:ORX92192.1 hypothetical protein K493DRAFT_303480 [Basidiobolus meristosporus CBS 931.73]